MVTEHKLNDAEIDALRETGNVGIGNAATALAKVIGKTVDIDIPEAKFISLTELANELGGPENIVAGIYESVSGGVHGESLLVFPEKDALILADVIKGENPGNTTKFDVLDDSAVKRIAEVFVNSYFSALTRLLDIKMEPETPHIANDMAQSVIDFILAKIGEHSDQMLIVKENISLAGNDISAVFVTLFDEASMTKILNVLNKMYGE